MLDDLIAQLNGSLKFRVGIFLLLAVTLMPLAFSNLSNVFFHAKVQHHCKVFRGSLNDSLPRAEKVSESSKHPYSSCNKYVNPSNHTEGTESCDQYEYYPQAEDEVTIVSEWDLVCEKSYIASMTSTIYFSVMLVAAPATGFFSDRFGRRPVGIACFYLHFIVGIGLYFANSLEVYMVLKTLLGSFVQGLTTNCQTLLIEFTRNDLRGTVGVFYDLVWPITAIILSGYAYLLHDWRELHLVTILTFSLTLFYFWIIPESVRWSVSTGRIKQAQKTLSNISKYSKMTVTNASDADLSIMYEDIQSKSKETENVNFFALYRTRKMALITFITGFLWFTLGICYWGLTFNIADISKDRYSNFFIGACLEVVGVLLSLFLINVMNRRPQLTLMIGSGSVTCMLGVILQRVNSDTVDTRLASEIVLQISKAIISGTYSPLVIYGQELFPTVLRTTGFASCIIATRIATLSAPQLVYLGDVTDKSVPFIVFSIVAAIGSGVLWFLPETKGRVMPNTIADVENRDSKPTELTNLTVK